MKNKGLHKKRLTVADDRRQMLMLMLM